MHVHELGHKCRQNVRAKAVRASTQSKSGWLPLQCKIIEQRQVVPLQQAGFDIHVFQLDLPGTGSKSAERLHML